MNYIKYHEIETDPAKNAHLAKIIESISANGWQGLPLLANGEQLLTGCHRYTACQILDVEPEVHDMVITLNWGDDDDWMLDELVDANNNDSLYSAIKRMHDAGYIDARSLEIIKAEYSKTDKA